MCFVKMLHIIKGKERIDEQGVIPTLLTFILFVQPMIS